MFAKITLTMITIILLFSLAGCGTPQASTPTANEPAGNSVYGPSEGITDTSQMLPVISDQVATISLDASANGTVQKLKQGEVLAVTLESNASTGYSWSASISDTAVLGQMAEPQYIEPPSSGTPLVGAPGSQVFFFQGLSTGSATITLDYARSWETDVAPIQTITITVDVQ
jgi:predicted secreted protein